MSTVQPIREKQKIDQMKANLKAQSLRNHLLFVFGINVGLRISDILEFRIKDVTNKQGRVLDSIEIYEKKTKKHKRFMINKNAKQAIQEYLRSLESYSGEDYLFKSRQKNRKGEHKAMTRFMAYKLLSEAAEKAGIEDSIGTHTLRKTFGYHAYKNGTDLSLLQYVFNHASPQVTLKYIGITQDNIDAVYINNNL